MKYIIVSIILLACVCDKARDAYRSNADWRTVYPRMMLVPRWLWRKFQDRWHIAKQIGFLLPLGVLDFLVWYVYGDWMLAVAVIPIAAIVWRYAIPDPDHWSE